MNSPAVLPALRPPSAARATPLQAPAQRPRRYCAAALLLLALAYLLIENGAWRPGPDTAYYISTSRSLALHGQFTFNGLPVGKIPPLWPLVLAGAMKLSASFWFLNLLPAALLVAASGFWFHALLRLVPPRRACIAVVLSGTLFYWYTGAADLRSEALFCLLLSAAVLLAFQVSEGRAQTWRIALIAILCALLVATRWAGLIALLPVAAAMLTGQLRLRLNRQWIGAAIITLTTIISFVALRTALTLLPGMNARPGQTVAPGESGPWEDMDAAPVPTMQAVIDQKGLLQFESRARAAGKWVSTLLWMPMYLGVASPTPALLTNGVGWVLIFLYLLCLYEHAARRQWIWVGALLYCAALIVRWPNVNARYLVPVAPLLLLGPWLGMGCAAAASPRPLLQRFWRTAAVLFLISIALVNLALWAIDVHIARSPDFYARYYAGETEPLLAAADYLHQRNLADGELAVSPYYVNLGRLRPNGHAWRSMHLLTNRGIRVIPKRICTDQPNDRLLEWAPRKGIKYYLYRPPVSPWRAHHFRIAWLQRLLTRQQHIPENPSWVLYRLDAKQAVQLDLPRPHQYPTRVPGL